MTKEIVTNVAASFHDRLLNKAHATNRPFNEVLQYFAMERFLYRLAQSRYAESFILKGALMFIAWRALQSRSTMDIDLLGITDNSVETLVGITKELCSQDVEPDGLVFNPETVTAELIDKDAEYAGVRVRFRGSLGSARITMQLDVGFGDVIVPEPTAAKYPTILELPPPTLKGYSRESAVAEKFEAMVKLDVINSRLKDFFDVWLISRQFDFHGPTLATAIERTFSNRGTTIPLEPVAITARFADQPAKQAQWQGFIRKNRIASAPADLHVIIETVGRFLGPVTVALANKQSFEKLWKAPGPWIPWNRDQGS
ncbi:MAG TPA: nucleotidyl transferase AbiEii/AbiGii toxin family protein [Acidobacteriota bacterium]|nr:MAG: hypothetical protein A3H45_06760 [Ignavibacteria bacterium RIFCSPLOWO2_02_FULL_55_14]HJZ12398.1 nucleotidyl transferase AbiEii/AbiGii toxin family protein [Acidobacteriota bacterium]